MGYEVSDKEFKSGADRINYRISKNLSDFHPEGRACYFGARVKGVLSDGFLAVDFAEKGPRRLNDDEKTVNDVLNELIVAEMEKVETIAAEKGFMPLKGDSVEKYFAYWGINY